MCVCEAYLDYCYGDEIVVESDTKKNITYAIQKVWIAIKTFFRKAIQLFKNFILNINMFKEAHLPDQENKDLQLVCQNLQPKHQLTNNTIMISIKALKRMENNDRIFNKEAVVDNTVLQIKNVVSNSIDDCIHIIKDVTDSKEYKRIMNNDYPDKNNIVIVPISNVVTSMKKTSQKLITYEGYIDKFTASERRSRDSRGIISACSNMYTKICQIYRMHISCLSKYFERAKTSVKAIKENIKDIKNKSIEVDRTYGYGAQTLKGEIVKSIKDTKSSNKNLTKESQVQELINKCLECGNDIDRFNEYKKYHDEICKVLGASSNSVIKINHILGAPNSFLAIPERKKPIKLLDTMQIYHTSRSDDELTELSGKYFFRFEHLFQGSQTCLFPTPRVYFSIGKPIASDGTSMNIMREKNIDLHVYVPKTKITTVYRDQEFSEGGACFVTAKSIPVKRLY